jgi:TPR repeat protein
VPDHDHLSDGLTAFNLGHYKSAYVHLAPLASENVPDAQLAVARMYHAGLGLPQDIQSAAYWYRLAAENDLAEAQFQLGVICFDGDDPDEALDWFAQAAEKGHEQAAVIYNHLLNSDTPLGC